MKFAQKLLSTLLMTQCALTFAKGNADTIFYGGPIVTVNAKNEEVQALAVQNGKIVAVGTKDAMKMITINAAYTLGVEDKVGSIEAGKFADFAVLNADPQTIPSIKIKDVGVVATILGGKVIPVSETKQSRPLH